MSQKKSSKNINNNEKLSNQLSKPVEDTSKKEKKVFSESYLKKMEEQKRLKMLENKKTGNKNNNEVNKNSKTKEKSEEKKNNSNEEVNKEEVDDEENEEIDPEKSHNIYLTEQKHNIKKKRKESQNKANENDKENENQNENENLKENEKENENEEVEEKEEENIKIREPSEKEIYLQDKLENLNYSNKIVKGVSEVIDNTMQQIHTDMFGKKILIPNNSRDIKNILPDNNRVVIKNNYDEIEKSKNNLKKLRKLKKNEEQLQSEIFQIEQNKKALENESFLNVSNSIVESNRKKSELKDLAQRHNNLLDKLNHIKSQVDLLLEDEKKVNRKNNIKEFLDKLSKSEINDPYDEKMHFLEEERTKLQQKRLNDLKKTKEKKNKILDEQEKKELNKKKHFIEEQRSKEKELIHKRKKEIDEKLLKTKLFIHNKFKKNIKEYLFCKMKDNYEQNENALLEKAKREKKSQLTSKEEIIDLERKIKDSKYKLEKQQIDKTNEMKEMWRNRSLDIPKYQSPILQKVKEEEVHNKEVKENEKIKAKVLMKEKIIFSTEKVPKPGMNEKLKKEREERILLLDNKNSKDRIQLIKNLSKKRHEDILIKQSNNIVNKINRINNSFLHSLNTKSEKSLLLNNSGFLDKSQLDNINNGNQTFNLNISSHRLINSQSFIDLRGDEKLKYILSKRYKLRYIPKRHVTNKPLKPKNYLEELRNQKLQKLKKNNSNLNIINKHLYNTDWKKIFSNPYTNQLENLQIAKNKISHIENKVHLQQELLRINGGCAKNQKLIDNIGDLLIDSIQAKLAIIDYLNPQNETS